MTQLHTQFQCPQCGPTKAAEDGCCAACGADACYQMCPAALAAIKKGEEGEKESTIRDMLALIHGDGGQRQNAEGTEVSLDAVASAFHAAIAEAEERVLRKAISLLAEKKRHTLAISVTGLTSSEAFLRAEKKRSIIQECIDLISSARGEHEEK